MSTWVGIHVFYNDQHDALLLEAVDPLVRRLKAEGWVDQVFFVRMGLGGPHIRLRLRCATDGAHEWVRSRAEADLGDFLARHPSPPLALDKGQRELLANAQKLEGGTGKELTVAPTNTLAFVPYPRESGSFGGPLGLALAEAHFDVSSSIAMRALARFAGREEQRLTLALEFMLHGVAAAGLSSATAIRLLSDHEARWMAYLPEPHGPLRRRFAETYAAQRSTLAARVRAAMGGGSASDPLLACWREELRSLRGRIVELADSGRLEFGESEPSFPPRTDNAVSRLLPLFLHRMNNRLGVLLPNEACLAFLARVALEEQG